MPAEACARPAAESSSCRFATSPRSSARSRTVSSTSRASHRSSSRSGTSSGRPDVAPRDVEGFDAVVIGGAGAHSVTEEYPFTAPLTALVRAGGRGAPAAVRLLLGAPVHRQGARRHGDHRSRAQGARNLSTSSSPRPARPIPGWPACRAASEFSSATTTGSSGCREGAVELAASALCPNQAFRLRDAPVYGAQFHVELDRERMLDRAQRLPRGVPLRPRRDGEPGAGPPPEPGVRDPPAPLPLPGGRRRRSTLPEAGRIVVCPRRAAGSTLSPE